jgi:hypothetical protein
MITIEVGAADDIRIAGGGPESLPTNIARGRTGHAKRAVLVGFLSVIAILSMPTEADAHLFGVLHALTDAFEAKIQLPDLRVPEMNNVLFHEPDNFL